MALSALIVAQFPAFADQWHEVDGASIRLLASGPPSAQGALQGALEIRLEPGWKTYWREPGETGVPPSVSISPDLGTAQPVIEFPPPVWVDDGYSIWAGYEKSVVFPVEFDIDGLEAPFEADIFVGVCETVCIPVEASFTIDPSAMFSHRDAERVVAGARAALPDTARDDLRIGTASIEDDALLMHAHLPEGVEEADLFIASDEALSLGQPKLHRDDGKAYFRAPVLNGGHGVAVKSVRYTLVADGEAVEGRIDLNE